MSEKKVDFSKCTELSYCTYVHFWICVIFNISNVLLFNIRKPITLHFAYGMCKPAPRDEPKGVLQSEINVLAVSWA